VPRQGRALEQLVAELERVLGPTDVVITSPDYIIGRESGSRREVDISLWATVGSARILVIIECRDRQEVQDVTWIEQLATKKEDVGANKAIAVCLEGFTSGAQNLAVARQIDVRTITSVADPEVFGWLGLRTLAVHNWWTEYRVIRPGIEHGRLEFDPALNEALKDSPTAHLVPMLVRRSDGAAVSVDDVWKLVHKDQAFPQLEADKKYSFTFTMDLRGEPAPYQVRTVDGLMDLVSLEIGGQIYYTEHEVPISRYFEYVGESGALIQTAEVEIDYEGAKVILGLNATPDKTRHSVTLRREMDTGPDVVHMQVGAVYEVADQEGTPEDGDASSQRS